MPCRLTFSPACAGVMLVPPRIAHSRSTRGCIGWLKRAIGPRNGVPTITGSDARCSFGGLSVADLWEERVSRNLTPTRGGQIRPPWEIRISTVRGSLEFQGALIPRSGARPSQVRERPVFVRRPGPGQRVWWFQTWLSEAKCHRSPVNVTMLWTPYRCSITFRIHRWRLER